MPCIFFYGNTLIPFYGSEFSRLRTSDFRLGLISADLRVVAVINIKHVEKYNRVISEQSVAKPNEAERLSKNKKRKKHRKNAMHKRLITEREKKYIN